MAPEMFELQSYTSKVDTWSFLVVIYTLLFGRHPFTGSFRSKRKI